MYNTDRPKPNIIIWVFDSLSPRYIKQWGGDIDFFPEEALDNLYILKNYYTAATVTLPSICTMFTGLYPKNHGVLKHTHDALSSDHPRLPSILADHGYVTSLVCTSMCLKLYYNLNMSLGFTNMLDSGIISNLYPAGTQVLDLVRDVVYAPTMRLHHESLPFFTFIHDYCTHIPYGQLDMFNDPTSDAKITEGMYVERIAEVADKLIPSLYKFAVDIGAILIITSDHGESFKGPNKGRTHGVLMDEDCARSVFAILNTEAGVDDGLHGSTDLMSTVLEMAKITGAVPKMDGMSIFKGHHDEVYSVSDTVTKWPEYYAAINNRGMIIEEFVRSNAIAGLPVKNQEEVLSRLRELGYVE